MMKNFGNLTGLGLSAALGLALATACNFSGKEAGKDQADSLAAAGEAAGQTAEPTLSASWKTDSVFTGSESTLYDPENKVIYVSCGNTKPGEKDGDGFVAQLNPDGSVKKMKWLSGLDAPKGMALLNDKLYLTDVDAVKVIDVASASIEKTIPVEGAKFLNDVATDGSMIYFSDSRAGVIYSLTEDGQVKQLAEAPGVNGLQCHNGTLFSLDKEGLKKYDADYNATLVDSTVTGGDGLIILDDNTFIASRWAGEVYLLKDGVSTLLLDTKAEKSNTADIGYIPGEKLVIVPTFMKNEVAAYQLGLGGM